MDQCLARSRPEKLPSTADRSNTETTSQQCAKRERETGDSWKYWVICTVFASFCFLPHRSFVYITASSLEFLWDSPVCECGFLQPCFSCAFSLLFFFCLVCLIPICLLLFCLILFHYYFLDVHLFFNERQKGSKFRWEERSWWEKP